MKICKKHGVLSSNNIIKNGIYYKCYVCHKTAQKKYYQKNKNKIFERWGKYFAEYSKRMRENNLKIYRKKERLETINMADRYIKRLIKRTWGFNEISCFPHKNIIELKKALLKLKRVAHEIKG